MSVCEVCAETGLNLDFYNEVFPLARSYLRAKSNGSDPRAAVVRVIRQFSPHSVQEHFGGDHVVTNQNFLAIMRLNALMGYANRTFSKPGFSERDFYVFLYEVGSLLYGEEAFRKQLLSGEESREIVLVADVARASGYAIDARVHQSSE
ncbi:MAG: hypothetical protein H6502_01645 [Candidatus Woesearchaeota archaeon]|nr:MAG: hypothetical protein H6502_01645 [Candidatus Woesearchaeota archaeon]